MGTFELEIGDDFLTEFDNAPVTQPISTPPELLTEELLTDYASRPIPQGTGCYFCDYAAFKRLSGGHPVCAVCLDQFWRNQDG